MRNINFFGAAFILLLLMFSCAGKSGAAQKTAKTAEENPNKILKDEILRKKYVNEISLAAGIINKLDVGNIKIFTII